MSTADVRAQEAAAADTPDLGKARGAFFTSVEVCDFVAEWAIRSHRDRVLEPSCGEAAFLLAAVARLVHFGAKRPTVDGFEIHAASSRQAADVVRAAGGNARIRAEDFLSQPPAGSYDAVVGNPPFVRYHGLTGTARAVALRAALAQGVVLPQLTNLWAPFVIHASAQLGPEGRLGLVLPAELLTAGFASEVRAFLLHRFKRVRLVLSDTALFPGVLTDALLLLAEGHGPTDAIEIVRVTGGQALRSSNAGTTQWRPEAPGDRWIPSLMASNAHSVVEALTAAQVTQPLSAWGRVSLGAVTGNNRFFALTSDQVRELDLAPSDLVRISPPGSRHLRAVTFAQSDLRLAHRAGMPTYLFRPAGEPTPQGVRYIRQGESEGVHQAYKCRIRDPWWRPPIVPVADLFVTYMNADTPRLAVNGARVRHLNSVHGLYVLPGLRDLVLPLAIASLNSATLLGAELSGRSYGGGILKLEPGEARKLPLPTPDLVRRHAAALTALLPQIKQTLATSSVEAAAAVVDGVLFADLPENDLNALRSNRLDLADRRRTRALSHRGLIC